MKRLIILAFIFSSILGYTQSTRQYLGLTVGPSFPLSDFAKTDFSDSTSGFAKTGINLKFVYSYRIANNFGIQAHFVYNTNDINNNSLTKEANKIFPGYSFSAYSKRPWSSGGVYAGPFVRIPFNDDFSWDIRAMIGLAGAYSPQFTINGIVPETNQKTQYYREFAKTFGIGFSFGTGFKYRIKNYLLLLNADYYYSNLNFKEVTGWGWTSPENLTGDPYNIKVEQKVNNISISIGFAYFL
jgi:hypothetical protein